MIARRLLARRVLRQEPRRSRSWLDASSSPAASGVIGRRLAPPSRCVRMARSGDMRPILRELGVEAAVVDVLDADRLRDAMAQLRPSIVVHQLTALPPGLEPSKMAKALVRNTRIRDEGTRNLVSAAIHAGARRLIAQSVAFVYATGTLPLDEQDPLDVEANDGMRGIPECDSIVMGQGPKVLSGHDRDERRSRCMSPGADSGDYP